MCYSKSETNLFEVDSYYDINGFVAKSKVDPNFVFTGCKAISFFKQWPFDKVIEKRHGPEYDCSEGFDCTMKKMMYKMEDVLDEAKQYSQMNNKRPANSTFGGHAGLVEVFKFDNRDARPEDWKLDNSTGMY